MLLFIRIYGSIISWKQSDFFKPLFLIFRIGGCRPPDRPS